MPYWSLLIFLPAEVHYDTSFSKDRRRKQSESIPLFNPFLLHSEHNTVTNSWLIYNAFGHTRSIDWRYIKKKTHQLVGLCEMPYAANRNATLSRCFRLFYFVISRNYERIMYLLASAQIRHLCRLMRRRRLVHLSPIFGIKEQTCLTDYTTRNHHCGDDLVFDGAS